MAASATHERDIDRLLGALATRIATVGTDVTPFRAHIIGGGGSGKTTLARRLAASVGVPHVDLDVAASITAPDGPGGWVTEGIFLYGTRPLFDAANVIVWLDLPWSVARRRIVSRHVRLSLAGKNPHRGLRLLRRFLQSQRRYYTAEARAPRGPTDWAAITRAGTEELLEPYADKLVHLRTPRHVARWGRTMHT